MNTLLFVGIVLVYVISMIWVTRSWKHKLATLKRTLTHAYEQERALDTEAFQDLQQQAAQRASDLQTALQQAHSDSQALAHSLEARNAEVERLAQQQQALSLSENQAQRAIAQLTADLTEKDAHTQALSGELSEAQGQRQALQKKIAAKTAECQNLTQDLEMCLEELQEKEEKIRSTQANNRELSRQLAELQQEVIQLKFSNAGQITADETNHVDHPSSTDQTELANTLLQYLSTSPSKPSLRRRLSKTFRNLDLVRNSIDEIMAERHNEEKFTSLVQTLQALNDGNLGELKGHKKVNATKRRWSECRVPHIDLLRIYFQKIGQDKRYQVLIASKGDSKTQAQDFAWLKSHIAS